MTQPKEKINYIQGDATAPVGEGNKIIAHICNDTGGWGAGFVLALSKRWTSPEKEYLKWFQDGDHFFLGNVQFVAVNTCITVANMIAQKDIVATEQGPPIRYEALRQCLEKVAQKALELNASVHMPRIGCGLAGGVWSRVEPLIQTTLSAQGVTVCVYDFG